MELEQLSRRELIDLYYGDESRVCLHGCVPYGWQFADEEVFVPSSQGVGLNCFALLTRSNACYFATTQQSIDSAFVVEQLEHVSSNWNMCLLTGTCVFFCRAHDGGAGALWAGITRAFTSPKRCRSGVGCGKSVACFCFIFHLTLRISILPRCCGVS